MSTREISSQECQSCKRSNCEHLGIKGGQFNTWTRHHFFCCQCYPPIKKGTISYFDKDIACRKCKSNRFTCGFCQQNNCTNLHWNTTQIVVSDNEEKIFFCCKCYVSESEENDPKIKPCANCKEDMSESEGEDGEKEEPEKKRQRKEEMENLTNVVYNLQEEMKKIRDIIVEVREKKPIKESEGEKENK